LRVAIALRALRLEQHALAECPRRRVRQRPIAQQLALIQPGNTRPQVGLRRFAVRGARHTFCGISLRLYLLPDAHYLRYQSE
jgi:hypothetical protein